MISALSERVWKHWISVTRSRCHLHFELEGGDLGRHVICGLNTGRRTIAGVNADVDESPSVILEVGSSVGFNCLALAESFPEARVVGIEQDREACKVGEVMSKDLAMPNILFVQGVGECMPFPDSSFDWIVCHTVIEHVCNVNACIAEMARVLRPGGYLHLDAPNYLWPWEPHLRIVIPPLCPKPFMRFFARLQGAGRNVSYAEHLQLVHPRWIEQCFTDHGLSWVNRFEQKLNQASSGDLKHIVAYRSLAQLFVFLQMAGVGPMLIASILRLGLYPSLLYTAQKPLKVP